MITRAFPNRLSLRSIPSFVFVCFCMRVFAYDSILDIVDMRTIQSIALVAGLLSGKYLPQNVGTY